MQTTQIPGHFNGLQILRFVAAMLVVVMHTSEAFLIRIVGTSGSDYWNGGSAGVDLFFVISGFVMALTTERTPGAGGSRWQQAWVFMLRRFVRIAPLYWFYLVLKIVLVLALPALALRTTLGTDHVLASFLFVPSMSPWGLIQPILPVGWTLNFEMLFYLVFALAIGLGIARLWFTLLVFTIVYAAGQLFPEVTALKFYSQSIIFEFVLGVIAAKIYLRYPAPNMAGGALLFVSGVTATLLVDWGPDADRLATWGIGCAMMVLGAAWLESWIATFKSAPWLSFLGDSSYSIYLSHTFTVPATAVAFKLAGITNIWVVTTGVCTVVIIVSCLSYLWVERPMINFFRNRVRGQGNALPAKTS